MKFMCHSFGFRDDASEFPTSEQLKFQTGDAFLNGTCKKEEGKVQQECAGSASLKGESSYPKKQGLLIQWRNKDPREPGKNKQALPSGE